MIDFDRYTHLTFDCYGTLIDWEWGIVNALRPLLAQRCAEQSDEQILELYGALEAAAERPPYRTYRDVLAAVVDGFGQRLGFTASAEERASLAASLSGWPPFPDTVAALQTLGHRYRLAVISNVDDDLFACSEQRLQTHFADVITAQQARSYKPDPRNFRLALQRLHVPAEQVLHVAQSLFHDIAPARELGLATVWINRRRDRPGFGATPPAEARPDLQAPDLQALARLVEKHGHSR